MVAKLNLLIPQGSTFVKVLSLRYPVFVKSKSANQLQTRPLLVAIPSGTQLLGANDVVLVTNANANQGDRALSIVPSAERIRPNTLLATDIPMDLTGQIVRGNIRPVYRRPSIAIFTCLVLDPTTAGNIQLSLTAIQTEGIRANITWENLPDNYQDQNNFATQELYERSFVWDMETVSGSVVRRRVEGRVFVTAEATRP